MLRDNQKHVCSSIDWASKVSLRLKPIIFHSNCFGPAMLESIIHYLPSPIVAQKYRQLVIYPHNDEIAQAIRQCNAYGPLSIFIPMINNTNGKFRAGLARIFSGSIEKSDQVSILPDKLNNKIVKVQQMKILVQDHQRFTFEKIDKVICGNIIFLPGLVRYIDKSGTVISPYCKQSNKFITRPTFTSKNTRIQIIPKVTTNLHRIIAQSQNISKNTAVIFESEDTGALQFIGSYDSVCTAYQQLQVATSEGLVPMSSTVVYKQIPTISANTDHMVKSSNRHNRIFGKANMLSKGQVQILSLYQKAKQKGNFQQEKYLIDELDLEQSKFIWCFQPGEMGGSILINRTKNVHYAGQFKEYANSAFAFTCREGALCGEEFEGLKIEITDTISHSDAIPRMGGQIIPPCRRLFWGLQLESEPTLYEPTVQIEGCIAEKQAEYFRNICELYRFQAQKQSQKPQKYEFHSINFILQISGQTSQDDYIQINEKIQRNRKLIMLRIVKTDWSRFQQAENRNSVEEIMKIRRKKGVQLRIPTCSEFFYVL